MILFGRLKHVMAKCVLSSASLSLLPGLHEGLLHFEAISKAACQPRRETTNHEPGQVAPPLSDLRYFVIALKLAGGPRTFRVWS